MESLRHIRDILNDFGMSLANPNPNPQPPQAQPTESHPKVLPTPPHPSRTPCSALYFSPVWDTVWDICSAGYFFPCLHSSQAIAIAVHHKFLKEHVEEMAAIETGITIPERRRAPKLINTKKTSDILSSDLTLARRTQLAQVTAHPNPRPTPRHPTLPNPNPTSVRSNPSRTRPTSPQSGVGSQW